MNVELPLSSSQISHSITVPEGEILTVCVVRSSTTATLNVVVKGESNPRKKSALGKNCSFYQKLLSILCCFS